MIAVALALALTLPPAAASATPGGVSVAKPKGELPADIGPSPSPAALDCTGAPVLTITATTDTVLIGDTTGRPDNSSGYSCAAWNESGGEAVTLLHVVDHVILTVTLSNLSADLDVFLLTSCDAAQCLVGATQEFVATLAPGDYVLSVDGVSGAAGTYHAALTCRAAGVPESVCQGGAQTVECAAAPTEIDGSIFGQPDLMFTYECSPYAEFGGERWYAVVVPDTATVQAKVSGQTFDAALWLFDGCGPAPQCLEFSDATLAGGTETLEWRNDQLAQRTVYLAVDSFRAPASEYDGEFHLTITCSRGVSVPVQAASWGTVKALYR